MYSLWGFETVPGAADSFEVSRVLGVGLDFFADAADVDVDRARCNVGGVTPHGIEQVVAAEDASFVTGEIVEQAEFGGGGRDSGAANGESHRRRIDFDVANFHRTGWQRSLEAAENGFHAGDEFAWAEGLCDIVVGSEFEAEDAVGFAAFGREKDYWNSGQAGRLANGSADLESIFAGDHDVENEERWPLAFSIGEDGRSSGINADDEALVLQMMADEAGNVRIVFNHEDAGFHGFIVAKPLLST